jgi:uncharacterized protein (TIGR03435 family)
MTQSTHRRTITQLSIAPCLFVLCLAAAPVVLAQADTTAADAAYVPTLTFDVVSIHESKDDFSKGFKMGGTNSSHASLVSMSNERVTDFIGMAYGVDARNISGGPDWASSTYFYLKANSDTSVDDKLAKLTDKQGRKEKQHMLQLMLAERLQLKVHQVLRDATVYDLVVAKSGIKLKGSPPVAATDSGPTSSEPALPPASKARMTSQCGSQGCEVTATSYSMQNIAGLLNGDMNAGVTDRTGLGGVYDFTLKWSAEDFGASSDGDDSPWPQLATAVKEQLGLELKPVKGTVVSLVIDHIEKPSEN